MYILTYLISNYEENVTKICPSHAGRNRIHNSVSEKCIVTRHALALVGEGVVYNPECSNATRARIYTGARADVRGKSGHVVVSRGG